MCTVHLIEAWTTTSLGARLASIDVIEAAKPTWAPALYSNSTEAVELTTGHSISSQNQSGFSARIEK